MRRIFCLVLVLYVWFASVHARSTTRSLSQLEGIPDVCNALAETDYPGNDIFRTPLETEGDAGLCCDHCLSTPGCVSWVLNTESGQCWLKNREGPAVPCGHCIGGTFVPEVQPEVPEACNVEFSTDYKGGDMLESPILTEDPAFCCQRCEETEGCLGWVLVTESGECWLKSALGRPTSCDGCTAGTRQVADDGEPTPAPEPVTEALGEPDALPVLIQCEREGTQAATTAALEACAILKNACPPFVFHEPTGVTVVPPAGVEETLHGPCRVVFVDACRRDALPSAAIVDSDCATILEEGPQRPVDNCMDTAEANSLFTREVEAVCGGA